MAKNIKHESAAEAVTDANTAIAPPADAPPKSPFRAGSKLALLVEVLERAEGATLAELQAATGWQGHSVRGAMAGSLKKQGLCVTSAQDDAGARRYRLIRPNT
jgi:hypothetical protein